MINKKVFFSLLAILLSTFIFFLFMEFIFRIFNIYHTKIDYTYNGIQLRKPNFEFKNTKENINDVFLNNFGFHDYPRKERSDKYRFALIGDSFVEALQVPRDSLFSTHLNNYFKLRKKNMRLYHLEGAVHQQSHSTLCGIHS